TTYAGHYNKPRDAIPTPDPTRTPPPPIWIGASGESTLRLVARHADVWNISGGDAAAVKGVSGKFEDACAAVGRDPSQIRRSIQFLWHGQDKAQVLEQSGTFFELGVTEQVIYMRGERPDRTAAKVAEMLPELRRLERVRS